MDAVKFQKSCLEEKFTQAALDRSYDSVNSFGITYGDHKRHLEFTTDQLNELKEHADELSIAFGVSPMDPGSMQEMINLRPTFLKIGSGDANNFQLIVTAAASGLPVILSTGMQSHSTIEAAVELIAKTTKKFAVLHCISAYPTAAEDTNLRQMLKMIKTWPHATVGYSGHELGFNASMLAVLCGARVVERHFTLDKTMKGSDHKCSLDPSEMQSFVRLVRQWQAMQENDDDVTVDIQKCYKGVDFFPFVKTSEFANFVDAAMGCSRSEVMYPCERTCYDKLGKSLVFSGALKRGRILEADDFSIKVANEKGVHPENLKNIVGKELKEDVSKDDVVMMGKMVF